MIPLSNKPKLSRQDILNGYVTRYFCKFISTGIVTEIDEIQFSKLQKNLYYQTISFKWQIVGNDKDVVSRDGLVISGTEHKNQVLLDFYEKKMPGLKDIIRSPLEYFSGTYITT